ncbi:MAG: TdeIII family type II restriction endonuclease [Prevotellaceae bacterium]|jgi:type II restriction enzyme|nr:TdeIII family type II restriction endonuclease [Prevotellaceae bacterium]
MALTEKQKEYVVEVIKHSLKSKFQTYESKDNFMPFHYRLLGKDRLALHSFMHSLLTNFGTTIFEPVAVALAKNHFADAKAQFIVGDEIYSDCQNQITEIVNNLTVGGQPNKLQDLELLKKSLTGKINKVKPAKADLYVKSNDNEIYLFDLKTVKPNKGDFEKFKQTLLTWAGICLTKDKTIKINTLLGIPYNPFYPKPYKTWTMRAMVDVEQELKSAEEFWDFLGGKGAYNELLDCFEQAGIELRPEIDSYFAKFNK